MLGFGASRQGSCAKPREGLEDALEASRLGVAEWLRRGSINKLGGEVVVECDPATRVQLRVVWW